MGGPSRKAAKLRMNRYDLKTPANIEPIRMDRFIKKMLPDLPPGAVREAFSRRDVKQNGVRVKADAWVMENADICLYTQAENSRPPDIVFEDEHILLLNKPQGISVHEDDGVGVTVLTQAKAYLKSDSVFLCHRLDNKTCGLLLLCKNEEAEKLLREAFFQRTIQKEYTCLVKGTPRPQEAVREAFLIKNAEEKKVRVITKGTPGALPIVTGYRVITPGETARLAVDLVTGRTHQIRAHMAFLGHPILGDDVYGDRSFNKAQKAKRLMLCASRLTLKVGGMLSYLDGQSFSIKVPF